MIGVNKRIVLLTGTFYNRRKSMAKKKLKFKLTPAGILFLAAIGVLIIALIAVIAVLSSSCKGDAASRSANASAVPSASAATTLPDLPVVSDDP